jgi:uncharacterized protein
MKMPLRHASPLTLPLCVLGALAATATLAVAASAQTNQVAPSLTAYGTADVRVTPDTAEVQFGVVTESTTATGARQENATRVTKVISAIKALGIPDNSIRTSIFQLEPVRRFPNQNQNQQGEPPIVGYRVTNIVTVRTTQLDLVPRIIDEAVKAGANRVDNIDFTVNNDAAPRQQALRNAVADARANADAMAAQLGVKLGRVLSVQQGGAVVPPGPIMYSRAAVSAAPTPIFPGEVAANAAVTVTYEIR